MKKTLILFLTIALCLSCVSCAGNSSALSREITSLTSGIEAKDIDVRADEVNNSGIRTFGLELLSLAEDDNPVISPLSAYLCLSMEANGADGVTAEEFSALLGGDSNTLNAFALAITEELSNAEESGTIFRVANSAWVDNKANIYEDYLTNLVTYYNAEMYSGELETSTVRKAINAWVAEKTEGMIPSLLSKNLPDDTMLTLINTIYMKATWQKTFVKEGTRKDTFHGADRDVKVSFMHQEADFDYIDADGVSGVILPYNDNTLAFVALKPNDGSTVRELLESLDSEAFSDLIGGAESTYLYLSMPKFTIDYTMDMNEPLKALGLVSAFDEDTADLSLMGTGANGYPLYLSSVLQKVKIIVDEEGTEAAAANMSTTANSAARQPIKFSLDEPFLYAIIDTTYNVPIFLGIMDNPAA